MPALPTISVLLLVGLLAGCGEQRAPSPASPAPAATYLQQVQPLLAARCVSCHQGASPSGGYDLSSHAGVLGPGSDLTRNAQPGQADSRLLTKLDSVKEPAHWGHLLPGSAELAPGEDPQKRREADLKLLTAWVVSDGLAYFNVGVHPREWVYPGDRDAKAFHGGILRARGWALSACQPCHGQDLSGGSSGKPCSACHGSGVTACTVCHGSATRAAGATAQAPPSDLSWKLSPEAPGVGAHQRHLNALWARIQCSDCHKVPTGWQDPGHLFDDAAGTSSDLRAELTFSDRAQGKLHGASPDFKPAYDRASATCSQVYCHELSGGLVKTWTWTGTPSTPTGCSSCHGQPPPTTLGGQAHPSSTQCKSCHSTAYTTSGALDPEKHLNGRVDR